MLASARQVSVYGEPCFYLTSSVAGEVLTYYLSNLCTKPLNKEIHSKLGLATAGINRS